jgi:hypothetical protein
LREKADGMTILGKVLSIWRTLMRGYLGETPVRGSRARTSRYIEEALTGQRPMGTLQVHYEIGIEGWEFGRTLLVVRGDGTVHVRNVTNTQVTIHDDSMSVADFHDLLVTIRDAHFCELDPIKENLLPDESEVMVAIVETTAPDKFWIKAREGQAQEEARFLAVLSKLRHILNVVSKGTVI